MKKEYLYGIFILICVWYIACLAHLIRPLFLPYPHSVFSCLIRLLGDSLIWKDSIFSLFRILQAIFFASIVGIPLGLLIGYYTRIYHATEVLIDFFRSLPALALYPLFMLFFGIGDLSKILTATFACGLIIILNTIYGVQNANKNRKIVAQLFEATPFEIFRKVIFMEALPQIFVGLRVSVSYAVIIIIATEMFVSTSAGLGHQLYQFQLLYRSNEIYSYIVIIGVLGYSLNKLFLFIENKYIHWGGK